MPPTAITYIHATDGCRSIGGGGWLTADAGTAAPLKKRLILNDFCTEAQEHGDGTFRPTAGRGVPSSAMYMA